MMTKLAVKRFIMDTADTLGVQNVSVHITEMGNRIAFTNGVFVNEVHLHPSILCSGLTDEELRGILAHEVAHLSLRHPMVRVVYLLSLLVAGLAVMLAGQWVASLLAIVSLVFTFRFLLIPAQEKSADLLASAVLNSSKGIISYLSKAATPDAPGRIMHMKHYSKDWH